MKKEIVLVYIWLYFSTRALLTTQVNNASARNLYSKLKWEIGKAPLLSKRQKYSFGNNGDKAITVSVVSRDTIHFNN